MPWWQPLKIYCLSLFEFEYVQLFKYVQASLSRGGLIQYRHQEQRWEARHAADQARSLSTLACPLVVFCMSELPTTVRP